MIPTGKLENALQTVRARIAKYRSNRRFNRQNTEPPLVAPVLEALGWNTDDPENIEWISDFSGNKKAIANALQKYSPRLQNTLKTLLTEELGKTWEDVEYDDEHTRHILGYLNRMSSSSDAPRMFPVRSILDNPKNENSIVAKLGAYVSNNVASGDDDDDRPYLRSPRNLERYVRMDPSTAPPIGVKQDGEFLWGTHRTLAAALRGDKEILAWVFD